MLHRPSPARCRLAPEHPTRAALLDARAQLRRHPLAVSRSRPGRAAAGSCLRAPYDPRVFPSLVEMSTILDSDGDPQPVFKSPDEARLESQRVRRAQVQDFVHWLAGQGVL